MIIWANKRKGRERKEKGKGLRKELGQLRLPPEHDTFSWRGAKGLTCMIPVSTYTKSLEQKVFFSGPEACDDFPKVPRAVQSDSRHIRQASCIFSLQPPPSLPCPGCSPSVCIRPVTTTEGHHYHPVLMAGQQTERVKG